MKNYYGLWFVIHVRIFIFIPFLCLIISTTSKCTSNKSTKKKKVCFCETSKGEEIIKIKHHKLTCIIKINNSSAWKAYLLLLGWEKATRRHKNWFRFWFLFAQIIKINNKNAKKSFIFQNFLMFIIIM